MIVATWLAYIMARKNVGIPVPGIPVVQVGTTSLVEKWLHKVRGGVPRFFRWMLVGTVAQQAESTSVSLASLDPQWIDMAPTALLLEDWTMAQPLRQSMSWMVLQDKLDTVLETQPDMELDNDF